MTNECELLTAILEQLRALNAAIAPFIPAAEPIPCAHVNDEAIQFIGRNGAPLWRCDDCGTTLSEDDYKARLLRLGA